MDANRKQRNLDDYARTHIRRRARRLVGVAGFRSSDTEDIEQELAIHLLKSLPNFDPGKAAYDTFVWRCVEVRVRELIRYRKREMRDYRLRRRSLAETVGEVDEDGNEHVEMAEEEVHDLRTGREARSDVERADLEMDVAQILAALPSDLRQVAEMLMTMSVSDAARRIGVPESTFRSRYLPSLRRVLSDFSDCFAAGARRGIGHQ